MAAIAGSKLFQDFQSAFAAATGFTPVLLSSDSKNLAEWMTDSQRTRHGSADSSKSTVPIRYGNRVIALLQIDWPPAPLPADEHGTRISHSADGAPSAGMPVQNKPNSAGSAGISPTQYAAFVQLLEIFSHQIADWFVRHAATRELRERPRSVRAMEWIEAHYHEPVTLTDAAKALGLTTCYFSKCFHQGVGTTFSEALWQTRTKHAKRLLADPRLTIREVAFAVGWRSISSFNRMFRRIVGCSASKFRATTEPQSEQAHSPM